MNIRKEHGYREDGNDSEPLGSAAFVEFTGNSGNPSSRQLGYRGTTETRRRNEVEGEQVVVGHAERLKDHPKIAHELSGSLRQRAER